MFDKLFSPITIRGLELPNRVVMSAMGTHESAASEDGKSVTQKLIDFHVARAKGGCGLIITGANTGIGFGCAKVFSEAGMNVVMAASCLRSSISSAILALSRLMLFFSAESSASERLTTGASVDAARGESSVIRSAAAVKTLFIYILPYECWLFPASYSINT